MNRKKLGRKILSINPNLAIFFGIGVVLLIFWDKISSIFTTDNGGGILGGTIEVPSVFYSSYRVNSKGDPLGSYSEKIKNESDSYYKLLDDYEGFDYQDKIIDFVINKTDKELREIFDGFGNRSAGRLDSVENLFGWYASQLSSYWDYDKGIYNNQDKSKIVVMRDIWKNTGITINF